MSKIVTRADAHLAGQLGIPVGEFHRLAFRAGADAIRQRYDERGEVAFPFRVGDERPEDTLPVYLPTKLVQLMREVCAAADIGTVGDYIAPLYEGMVAESVREVTEGKDFGFNGMIGDIVDGYTFDDSDDAERKMVEAVKRWHLVDGELQRTEAAVAA